MRRLGVSARPTCSSRACQNQKSNDACTEEKGSSLAPGLYSGNVTMPRRIQDFENQPHHNDAKRRV